MNKGIRNKACNFKDLFHFLKFRIKHFAIIFHIDEMSIKWTQEN